MQKLNYVDAPEEKFNLKGKAGSAIFGFLSELATAKEQGQKMPKVLDKLAGLVVKGKNEGVSIAKETAKEQLKIKLPLIIMGVVIVILVAVLIYKNK